MTSGGETGNAPQIGPCSLYADWPQVERCCSNLQPVEDDEKALLLEVATMVVYGLTKGAYTGQCSKVLFPCQPICVRENCCRCPVRTRFDLGTTPVWWASVIVDGEEIPVIIEDYQYVVRNDDIAYWPTCEHNWSIAFTWGWPIPSDISMATALLTCELAKQCQGQSCALDPRTTSYTREGVTVQIADPNTMISAGKTGIPMVDMLIFNPIHQRSGGIVDLAENVGWGTTWTPPVVPT